MRYRELFTTETASGAGIIKPVKPLTPAQASQRAEHKAGIQKRIRDKQAASAREVADLRAKLTD